MERDELFLRVLDDLEGRVEPAPDEYDVLGIAALLRKLLIDNPSLVHLVNREHRVKVRFTISVPRRIWEIAETPKPALWSLQDGLDPETTLTPETTSEVNLADFLRQVMIISGSHEFSVRDVITHAANVAGAVHAGKPRSLEHEKLEKLAKDVKIGGYDLGTRDLQPIGRVTVRGLQPLREAIETARQEA
jgi:hypothetical protein